MRPSLPVLKAVCESHPNHAEASRVSGLSGGQVAGNVLGAMDNARSPRERDAILSSALAAHGIYTPGVSAFDAGSDQWVNDGWGKEAGERQDQRLSEQSRQTAQYWSPERIKYVRGVAKQSSLTQGLADRFRKNDARAGQREAVPTNARLTAYADDERDRRAALNAAISSTHHDRGLYDIGRDDTRSLRDTLSAAFDADTEWQSQQNPLDDEYIANLTDAV